MTKILCYADKSTAHHWEWVGAFYQGLIRHGIEVALLPRREYRPSDVAVFWAMHFQSAIRTQAAHGGKIIVLERGFIDRMDFASVGWGGICGHADFCNQGAGPDRYASYFSGRMQPWHDRPDGPVIVAGQVPGDASCRDLDERAWLARVADHFAGSGRKVIYRPHPEVMKRQPQRAEQIAGGLEVSTGALHEDLSRASEVVTWSSNVAVDATMAGVPCVAQSSHSMLWGHAAAEPGESKPFDRRAWACRIANAQWTVHEIAEGIAWDQLKRGLED